MTALPPRTPTHPRIHPAVAEPVGFLASCPRLLAAAGSPFASGALDMSEEHPHHRNYDDDTKETAIIPILIMVVMIIMINNIEQ